LEVIVLDGKEFESIEKIHRILKKKLDLPDYYGENLNALWDCLTGWIDLPVKIQWINFEYSKNLVGSYADELLETFREAEDELDGFECHVSD
jgi:ribonuclease inhibitor